MFWTYLIGLIAFIIILGLIVLVHEAGHFYFAKRAGILCYEFSIGMGPVIWQKKKGETVYSIRAIPIGGYVSMAGEEVEANPLKGKAEVKLIIENNQVTTIILDLNNPKYDDLPVYSIVKYDLIGTKFARSDELYIIVKDELNREYYYQVTRDALVNYSKKATYQIAPYNRNFTNKKLSERFSSLIAGPLMNFLLAILLFFIIGFIVGYPVYENTVIDNITEDAQSYQADLRNGDKITKINNHETKVWDDIGVAIKNLPTDFNGMIKVEYTRNGVENTTYIKPKVIINVIQVYLNPNGTLDTVIKAFPQNNDQSLSYKAGLRPNDEIVAINDIRIDNRLDLINYFENDLIGIQGGKYKVTIKRDGIEKSFDIKGFSKEALESQGISATKMQLDISPEHAFNLTKLLYRPIVETADSCLLIFRVLGLLFKDKSVGISDLSGPIGIFSATVTIAKGGLVQLLGWAAMLSVNIGFLNLLPLPALDGGRLAFLGYEAITKKKPNTKVENAIHMIGFILFMGLFVFVTFSDILNCIGI